MADLAVRPAYRWAWLLAAVLTLLNAAKPAVVDDTAYLFFARHLAHHPGDPYGFELFWYAEPQPAMQILMPPVLPCWLAAGISLFGEHLFLLKLWLFPFAAILCRSTAWLVTRFAIRQERTGLLVIALSPAVLVLFDFMLDIPALALGLTALTAFIHGCDRRSLRWVAAAGLLAGLAVQTKYSLLFLPAVFVWYALLYRRWLEALLAVSLAVAVFGSWEWWLIQKYGHSHFLFHAKGQSAEGGGVTDMVAMRLKLVPSLLGQFGGLMVGVSLWVCAGFRPRAAFVGALVCAAMLLPVFLLPHSRWRSGGLMFQLLGLAVFAAHGDAAWALLRKTGAKDWAFLLGWVLLEIAGALGLSPFPAARRMLGVCFALSLLGVCAVGIGGIPLRRAAVGSAVYALLFFAVDCWDAYPEKTLAERAGETARPGPGEIVWYNGHWGFQYYCDRVGMKPVIPGHSTLKPGDWLVYPLLPDDDDGFFRPWHGGASFFIDPNHVENVATWTWNDVLPAQTVPNLYGGDVPIQNRDYPRLKVGVFRVVAEWSPERE